MEKTANLYLSWQNIFIFDKDELGRVIVKPNKNNEKWLQEYASFIWADMSYPVYGVTRKQMKENLKEWGYSEVWKFVWFCYKCLYYNYLHRKMFFMPYKRNA